MSPQHSELSFSAKLKQASLHIGAALFLTAVLTPLQIYLSNDAEFTSALGNMLQHALPYLLVTWLLTSLVCALLPAFVFTRVLAVTIAITILAYLQANVLVWDYGLLSGEPIDWDKHYYAGLLDSAVWIIGLGLSLTMPLNMIKFGKRACLFFVAVALIVQISQLTSKDVTLWQEAKANPVEQVYKFSPQKNILVFVLDSFLAPAFDAAVQRSPELLAHLGGFTYYQNMLSAFSTTAPSIPALLTGKQYDNSIPLRKFWQTVLQEESLPYRAMTQGFDTSLVTLPQLCARTKLPCYSLAKLVSKDNTLTEKRDLAELLDVALFRFSPQVLKVRIYSDEKWFLQRILVRSGTPRALYDSFHVGEGLARSVSTNAERPTFKFIHLLLPHPPFRFDEHCGVVSKRGAAEKELYEDQAICTLRKMGEIFQALKEHSLFDVTTIVIVADHGHSLHYMPFKRPQGFPILEQAMPLLLVKPPHSQANKALETTQAPASTIDIARTIAEAAGIVGEFPGVNILNAKESDERVRTYRSYGWQDSFWKRDYLPKMEEFIVNGNVRDPSAWTRGAVLTPPSK